MLVVEDDRDIAELVRLYLEKAGHAVRIALSGDEGLAALEAHAPEVLILDVMLPGRDGYSICRAVRAADATRSIPIIMLSARADEFDRVHRLELGADDYIVKPFSPKELVARVAALERRLQRGGPEPLVQYGALAIDRDRHIVSHNGAEVALTPKEFLLLEYFIRHRGRVLSRERLLSDVWGYQYAGATRTVDVHVRRLRKKLPPLTEVLSTVHQFGYKLLESDGPA